MISDMLAVSISVGVFALLFISALSPVETLTWWAGWTEEEIENPPKHPLRKDPAQPLFVVYLSGVASISGAHLLRREKMFIEGLKTRLPEARVIADVFPYSPSGMPLLAAPRIFDRFWRRIQRAELQGRRSILKFLINIRNIYQVMVSADHRYGPIFSRGAADAIERALTKAGYARDSGAPIAVIGYSGGAQVAVGAAPFLTARLGAPVHVVSIGGVIASDPGLATIERLHHFAGDGDRIEKIGALMFAERWRLFANSHWNEAKRNGRIVIHRLLDVIHAGPKGYFGLPKRGAQSNNERMIDKTARILSDL